MSISSIASTVLSDITNISSPISHNQLSRNTSNGTITINSPENNKHDITTLNNNIVTNNNNHINTTQTQTQTQMQYSRFITPNKQSTLFDNNNYNEITSPTEQYLPIQLDIDKAIYIDYNTYTISDKQKLTYNDYINNTIHTSNYLTPHDICIYKLIERDNAINCIQQLIYRYNQLYSKLFDYKQQNTKHVKNLSTTLEQNISIVSENILLQNQCDQYNNEINELNDLLNNTQNNYNTLQDDYNKLLNKFNDSLHVNETLQNSKKQLQDDYNNIMNELDTLDKQNKTYINDNNILNTQLQQCNTTISILQQQIDRFNKSKLYYHVDNNQLFDTIHFIIFIACSIYVAIML